MFREFSLSTVEASQATDSHESRRQGASSSSPGRLPGPPLHRPCRQGRGPRATEMLKHESLIQVELHTITQHLPFITLIVQTEEKQRLM